MMITNRTCLRLPVKLSHDLFLLLCTHPFVMFFNSHSIGPSVVSAQDGDIVEGEDEEEMEVMDEEEEGQEEETVTVPDSEEEGDDEEVCVYVCVCVCVCVAALCLVSQARPR